MSGPQNSENVKILISKLRKSIKTIVNIDDLLPILDDFYNFLTTESKQLPASKVKKLILKILYLLKCAIKPNEFIDDNETKSIYKHKLCKIISFYIDVELFSVVIGKDSSENITSRISTTIDSYINEPENVLKLFRASLQIKKGKQIMKFKDIVIALFTKYFYRQARPQPLIVNDVLFLEQLSIYNISNSLLDSQAHKDELIEMVVNYMVPLNKQILMSQLGITDADNFMNEALKTTSQQVIEKAIINNTEIIELDPENSDSHVSSNINEILLVDIHQQTVDKVRKSISWLDNLSIKTAEKLIKKKLIIEINDDDDDIEIVELSNMRNYTNFINTSNSPFKVNPVIFSSPSTSSLLKPVHIEPPEILHSTEPEVETKLPFKKRKTDNIECPNRNEYESCETLQQSTKKNPVPSDQEIVEPCSNKALTLSHKVSTSYPATPMISIATIAHLLHENNPTNSQQQNIQNTINPINPAIDYHSYHGTSIEPVVNSNNYFKSIDFKSGLQHSLAGSGNIQSNSRGTLPSSSRHQDQNLYSIRDHNQSSNSKKSKSSSKRNRHAQKSNDSKDFVLNDEQLRKGDKVASKKYQMIKKIILKKPKKLKIN